MRFVVLDIETTGLNPEINEIIEIGAIKLESSGKKWTELGRYEQKVKPYRDIPPVVQGLTGLKNSDLADAPRFADIAQSFCDFLEGAILVAHNAAFDFQTINICLERAGLPKIKNEILDTQDLVALAFPTMPSHRLGDIVDYLGISTGDLHRALADAEATAKILQKTIEKFWTFPLAVIWQINKILQPYTTSLKDIFAEIKAERIVNLKAEDLAELNDWAKAIPPKNKFKKSRYAKSDGGIEEVPLKLVEKYFGKSGIMAKKFPAYEYRPQQTIMAEDILKSFNNSEHLLIEAGTGTGKSAAYLLPIFLWIKQNGGPLIVSTRTKNLQDQLLDKDIPALLKLFPKDNFQVMLLKGRQNYVCLRRFELLLQQLLLSRSKDIVKVLPIFAWLVETADGDLSELHSSIEKRWGRYINSEAVGCMGERCPEASRCFLQHARKQAKNADLVVANHSLVFVELAKDTKILPNFRKIVLDEAHTIEDALTEAFSVSIGFALFQEKLKEIIALFEDSAVIEMAEELRDTLRQYFTILSEIGKELKIASDEKMILTQLREESKLWLEAEKLRFKAAKQIKRVLAILEQEVIDLVEENKEDENEEVNNIILELKTIRAILEQAWLSVENICEGQPNYVSWLQITSGKVPYNVQLEQAPIDIGEILQESLFAQKNSVIMTSATLTVGGSFAYFKQRFGIKGEISNKFRFVELGSPYDYSKNMLCVLPDDLPSLANVASNAEYVPIAEYLVEVMKLLDGKTLVLFTSYKMLEQVYRLAKQLLEDTGITILCQGLHGSRRSLLSRFKNNRKTVLFGTNSFWEGVDVQGEALSCVVIVKLPFSVPSEPLFRARSELITQQGGDAFNQYAVPQAVLRFKQGIGRLIRSQTDFGAVLIIDDRIFSKNYGKTFLRSLPNCKIYKGPAQEGLKLLEEWFSRVSDLKFC